MINFLTSKWELVLGAVFTLLKFFGITPAKFKKLEWVNESLFFIFAEAERLGIERDLPGFEKLNYYIERYKALYRSKFGVEPSEKELEKAAEKAAKMAEKEKEIRKLSDPS